MVFWSVLELTNERIVAIMLVGGRGSTGTSAIKAASAVASAVGLPSLASQSSSDGGGGGGWTLMEMRAAAEGTPRQQQQPPNGLWCT